MLDDDLPDPQCVAVPESEVRSVVIEVYERCGSEYAVSAPSTSAPLDHEALYRVSP